MVTLIFRRNSRFGGDRFKNTGMRNTLSGRKKFKGGEEKPIFLRGGAQPRSTADRTIRGAVSYLRKKKNCLSPKGKRTFTTFKSGLLRRRSAIPNSRSNREHGREGKTGHKILFFCHGRVGKFRILR